MEGSREGTTSPQQGHLHAQYHQQPAGLGLEAAPSQNFGMKYEQQLPPPQNDYNTYGGNQYMNPMQPGLQQSMAANEYRDQYKRSSIGQRPAELALPGANNPYQDYNPSSYSATSDQGFLLDPSLQSAGQPQDSSINPADLMGSMSPSSTAGHTPPNMINNRSPQHSPSMPQGQFHSPGHSRNASLDPSSAHIAPGQHGDWSGIPAFRHHRAPSEHSDISSVTHSPYIRQDGFDNSHSPLLNAEQDGVYPDSLRMEQFSISDQQHQQGHPAGQYVSPHHSPYPSPRMSPHNIQNISEPSQFVLPSNGPNNGGPFGSVIFNNQDPAGEMGHAASMAPPEINVVYAPPSGPTGHARDDHDLEGLSPPEGEILPTSRMSYH
jgi:hypothetical protein